MTTGKTIRYPGLRQELLDLEQQDQVEVRGHYRALLRAKSQAEKQTLNWQLAKRCHARAKRMLEIMAEIGVPTVANIGVDGSQAVAVLALHAPIQAQQKILDLYQKLYAADPTDVYYQAIPPLTDRIMILQERRQLYGTNWAAAETGELFLIPVKDFSGMNKRRAQFGLEPARKPTILSMGAKKHPLGTGKATAMDQKDMTDDEYAEYARYYLEWLE